MFAECEGVTRRRRFFPGENICYEYVLFCGKNLICFVRSPTQNLRKKQIFTDFYSGGISMFLEKKNVRLNEI